MANSDFTIALKTDGTAYGWGRNDSGQLGIGSTTSINTLPYGVVNPTAVSGNKKYKKIAQGGFFTIAIAQDNTLWGWGSNSNGQLLSGPSTPVTTPKQLSTETWIDIACGQFFAVGIKSDGSLWGWGANNVGQLGSTNTADQTSMVRLGTDNDWVFVAANYETTFAIKNDGTLWATGNNTYNQISSADTNNKTTLTKIGSAQWKFVAAGAIHVLGIQQDGTLWSWGDNTYGRTGLGTTTGKTTVPTKIGTANNWIQAYCGDGYSLAVRSDGTLWAWGLNNIGQFGLNDTSNRSTPTNVTAVSNVKQIWCGSSHTFILLNSGSLLGTGSNYYGNLGIGTSNENKYTFQILVGNDWGTLAIEPGNQAPTATPTSPLGTNSSPALTSVTPRLQWSYSDPEGNPQYSYLVKIYDATTNSLVGQTPNTPGISHPYYDVTSGFGGTGLTAGKKYYWTVQVTDSAGMISSVSAPQYFLTNNVPTISLTSPANNQVLSEGSGSNTLSVNGSATDVDNGNVVTVKYKINNGPTRALQSGVSNGSTPISFAKNLTYHDKRLWDGSTDVVGADLAEGTNHTLTVWAEDDQGGISNQVTRTFTVVWNRPPVISGANENLGTILVPPTKTYSVTEPENDSFTITEKINGTVIRTFAGTAGQEYTVTIPHDRWIRLDLDMPHSLTVEATDIQGLTSTRTFTFVRTETHIEFMLDFDNPDVEVHFTLDGMPKRVLVTLEKYLPPGSSIEFVKVCNNAEDEFPAWEDATAAVSAGRGYLFTNQTKTAASWRINIWVSIAKGTATERVRLDGYGGAFD